jgi:hypothetical protein
MPENLVQNLDDFILDGEVLIGRQSATAWLVMTVSQSEPS